MARLVPRHRMNVSGRAVCFCATSCSQLRLWKRLCCWWYCCSKQQIDHCAPEAVTKVRLVALKLAVKTAVSSVRSSHSSRRTCPCR